MQGNKWHEEENDSLTQTLAMPQCVPNMASSILVRIGLTWYEQSGQMKANTIFSSCFHLTQYFDTCQVSVHWNCPLFPCPLLWDNWSNKHNCILMTTTTYGHEVRWNTRRGTKLIFSLSLQLLVPDQWVSPLACCWIYVRIRTTKTWNG